MTNPDREELVKLADKVRDWMPSRRNLLTFIAHERRLIETALRRLASSDSGVKVRELEWSGDGIAQCVFGFYDVSGMGNGTYRVTKPNCHLIPTVFSDIDAAKAAAQADYEARIKSALVEVPTVKGEPEPVARIAATLDGDLAIYAPGHNVIIARFARGGASGFRDGDRLYTAPPADAGMREAYSALCLPRENQASDNLEGALYDIERLSAQGKPTDDICIRTLKRLLKQIVRAEQALTAPGVTSSIYICYDGYGHYYISRERPAHHVAIAYDEDVADELAAFFNRDTPTAPGATTESDVEALAATTAERPGTVTSEPEPSTSDPIEQHLTERNRADTLVRAGIRPSDPSSIRSEVTVECIHQQIFMRVHDALDDKVTRDLLANEVWTGTQDAARALLDQFEIRRKK